MTLKGHNVLNMRFSTKNWPYLVNGDICSPGYY